MTAHLYMFLWFTEELHMWSPHFYGYAHATWDVFSAEISELNSVFPHWQQICEYVLCHEEELCNVGAGQEASQCSPWSASEELWYLRYWYRGITPLYQGHFTRCSRWTSDLGGWLCFRFSWDLNWTSQMHFCLTIYFVKRKKAFPHPESLHCQIKWGWNHSISHHHYAFHQVDYDIMFVI